MASFVIHDICGEVFLEQIKKTFNISLTEKECTLFLMGNLIPDSSKLSFPKLPDSLTLEELKKEKTIRRESIQREKQSTHFRSFDDIDKNIQVPNINLFLEKYRKLLTKNISVLGYLFHLYTDKEFFGTLFNKTFIFLDKDKYQTDRLTDTHTIILTKDNQEYAASTIFNQDSETSIYHDYTTMNSIFLSMYKINYPCSTLVSSIPSFTNPGITEVDYQSISIVLSKTNAFIEESLTRNDYSLKVFNQSDIKTFIDTVVSTFIKEYQEEILSSITRNLNSSSLKYLRRID